MRRPTAYAWFIILLGSGLLWAGPQKVKARMKNGDVLSGVLLDFEGQAIRLDSEYAGRLMLPLPAVIELNCDRVVALQLADGTRLEVHLKKISGEELHLQSEDRIYLVSRKHVVGVYTSRALPEAVEPEVRSAAADSAILNELIPDRWSFGANFGYKLNRSTISTDDLYFRYHTDYSNEPALISLKGHIFYGLRDETLSKKEIFTVFRYDYKLREDFYWFGLTSGEYDAVEQIDLRNYTNFGLGFSLVNRSDFRLNFDSGLGVQYELYADRTSNTTGNALFVQHLLWKLNHKLTMKQNFAVIPYLTGLARQRLLFDFSLNTALTRKLQASFSIYNKFDSRPPFAGVSRNDFTTIFSLGVEF